MWPRMIVLAVLVALLVGGTPSAGAAHELIPRGHAQLPHALGTWSWPVAPPHTLARPYLTPATAYAAGHRGIDIRVDAGSPIRAPADGVVHFAGVVADRPVLSIEHDDGVLSSFEPVTATVVVGDTVSRGEVIGVLGAGHCAASCLHLGVRVDGAYVNPLLFLGGVPWSVLLPGGG